MNDPDLTPDEWNSRYAHGRPGWDLDGPPPILEDVIAGYPEPQKVFVPCAGLGHDAIAWALAGHEATAVDFAQRAVEGARRNAAARDVEMTILQADLFHLPRNLINSFDIAWEQTCLAAIKPDLRRPYFENMAQVLRGSGTFLGLLWNHGRSGGPPYDISMELVKEVAGDFFNVVDVTRVDPSRTARNPEFLVHLRKKDQ